MELNLAEGSGSLLNGEASIVVVLKQTAGRSAVEVDGG
jgi:hypothetical protein